MTQERVIAKVQYIKDLSFEVPRAPAIYRDIRLPPMLDVHLEARSELIAPSERIHEVVLTLRVAARQREVAAEHPQAVEFIAELSYGGLFDLSVIEADAVDEILSVECPHILYPFACAILSDLSRDANFAPLALGPVDFQQLWHERRRQSPAEGSA